jgi:hypothetical protein
MRAKKFVYTLTALHADGFCENVTGTIQLTAWTTIAGAPGDGCSHQTTLASTSNLSGVNITVTGTDAENRVLAETIAGPNNTTVSLTNYFKTVTKVTADATLGAATMNVGWTALAYTPTYPCAVYPHDGPAFQVNLGGTTVNYTKQQTNDDLYVNNPAQWHTLGTATIDADSSEMAIIGATGIRVWVHSHTSGVLYMTVSQARA